MQYNSSVSDYRSRCSEYILNGFKYPRMYFNNLHELWYILFGHALAHEQIGLITRDDSFNDSFARWLYVNHKLSCQSGWDRAINTDASNDESAIANFKVLAIEFLNEWNTK